jgi:pyrimidine-nucleoside phosphorylase
MLPQEFIRNKRNGLALSESDLESFFGGFLKGDVADYQMSAMLMAIYMKGMEPDETAIFTKIMRDSGTVFDWPFETQQIVDKHSTGGVGDKTSLVIMPLAILEGLKVPMISGRGLGHTGGTLDKLESIGINVFFDSKEASRMMDSLGGVFMGQTEEMVPLDRRLYAMRDVTATVESIPLIVASILSKKLAEGIGGLVMDIKFGSGAFMDTFEKAQTLANSLKAVGTHMGIKVKCLLTSMNSPLGEYAGNGLEVLECVELMQGKGPESTKELIVELTAEMVKLGYPERDDSEIRDSLRMRLSDGSALELFTKMVHAQGGDTSYIENPEKFKQAKVQVPLLAKKSGFISEINTRDLGMAILQMGGGRKLTTDGIDPWVGLGGLKRIGDRVETDEPIAVIYCNDQDQLRAASETVLSAYSIGENQAQDKLIAEIMK